MAAFLVQHPNGNVLVDSGPNPDVYSEPNSVRGPLAKSFEPVTRVEDDLLAQLKKIEIEPRDINYVVNTHLHFDHAGGNRIFKDSTFLVSVHELE
ncbi:MAG: MBL fold metallo-hydrolase [Desulfobacterales bacterium]|jgi:glyoxylase-like metal-dependent hydrolase (beta-lactamase superfamily II)